MLRGVLHHGAKDIEFEVEYLRQKTVSAASACIYAGGAHHTCFSQAVHTQFMRDFAEMAGIELVEIGKETDLKEFKKELQWDEVYHRICTA